MLWTHPMFRGDRDLWRCLWALEVVNNSWHGLLASVASKNKCPAVVLNIGGPTLW